MTRSSRSALALIGMLFLASSLGTRSVEAQEWRTLTTRRELADERHLRVDLEFGAGKLRVEPARGDELYHASIRYDASNFEPTARYTKERLELGIEGRARGSWRQSRDGSSLTLGLGAGLPIELNLSFGAVEAELELGGLRIRRAEIATGASKAMINFSEPNREDLELLSLRSGAASFHATGLGNANARKIDFGGGVGDITLSFDGKWQHDTSAEVSLGVGALTLVLPREVGVRIIRETFLVSFTVPGLVRRGDGYYSEGWDGAQHRLTIVVSGAFGSLNIRWAGDEPA